MLSSMRNMIRVPDLRNKVLFTLLVIIVYRVGSQIPVPGVDLDAVASLERQTREQGGALAFLQLFSGGALTKLALFALGIMPYITSSIIMQVLTVVIPRLEQWQNQGAVGQRKITQWTRYLAIAVAAMQSAGLAVVFHRGGGGFFGQNNTGIDLIPRFNAPRVLLIVLCLTAGTSLLMWLGELITQRGIGNGMSILIFSSVVSGLPAQLGQVKAESDLFGVAIVLAAISAMLVAIVFVEQGQRRIPVQFAKRVVGRRMTSGGSTYIPLKVNQAGVVPIIFASSLLYLPKIVSAVLPGTDNADDWGSKVQNFLSDNLSQPDSIWYLSAYGLLIVAFAYFYTAIAFDPVKQADVIRKQGGFIPGIRPGPQTERYLAKILNRITLPGALFMALVALLPPLVLSKTLGDSGGSFGFAFGGTSVLIAVGVALETMKQIDSQLMMRNYEGFLK